MFGRTLPAWILALIATSPVSAQPKGTMPASPMAEAPTRIVLSDVVDAKYRDSVLAVVKKPTISTRGVSQEITCDPAVFQWLIDHPDRTSLAWQRLKVPCVEIKDTGKGSFTWIDGEGSEIAWQVAGRFKDGLVWYATGKVKVSPVTPTVPVKAVVVMVYPSKPVEKGAAMSPVAHAYLQTDSKAANVVLRVLGPTTPKLAEQGAEQLLYFFTGISRYLHKHPDRADELLGPKK